MDLLTRALVDVHSRSTTQSTSGVTVATLNEKVEFGYASPATESGRRTARPKIPTELHFQFHRMGVPKEGVPPALLSVV